MFSVSPKQIKNTGEKSDLSNGFAFRKGSNLSPILHKSHFDCLLELLFVSNPRILLEQHFFEKNPMNIFLHFHCNEVSIQNTSTPKRFHSCRKVLGNSGHSFLQEQSVVCHNGFLSSWYYFSHCRNVPSFHLQCRQTPTLLLLEV